MNHKEVYEEVDKSIESPCRFVPHPILCRYESLTPRLNRNGFARYVPTRPDECTNPQWQGETLLLSLLKPTTLQTWRNWYKKYEIVRLKSNSLKIQQSIIYSTKAAIHMSILTPTHFSRFHVINLFEWIKLNIATAKKGMVFFSTSAACTKATQKPCPPRSTSWRWFQRQWIALRSSRNVVRCHLVQYIPWTIVIMDTSNISYHFVSFHDKLTKLNFWDAEFRDWSGFAWYIIGGMGGPGGAGGA